MHRSHAVEPQLITSAPESNDYEYDRRRKKYAIMMSIRTLCVILAAVSYQVSAVLACAFLVGGAVLPWCAVLIANDRPAKKPIAVPVLRPQYGSERALTGPDDGRTIDL
jgi:hypothetical protein